MNKQRIDPNSFLPHWQPLSKITNTLSQNVPLDQRLSALNDILVQLFNVDAIWFLTVKPLPSLACGLVRTPLTIAPEAKITMVDTNPAVEGSQFAASTVGQVMTSRVPYFAEYVSGQYQQIDADLGDTLFGAFDIATKAIIPLIADNILLGVLVIGNHTPTDKAFSDEGKDFLIYIGQTIAQCLHTQYLKARSKRHTEALVMLNQIAQTITSTLDIDDVIQRTMSGINQILDVEAGSLLLIDERAGELFFKVTLRGENKQITSYRLKIGEGVAGWVSQHNKPALVNNPRADKRFSPKIDEAIGFVTTSILCVPLVIQGKPIGAVEVVNKRQGYFTEDDQDLLVLMVASLSVALKNVALYEDAQKRAHRNQVISHVTAAINAGHGLSETTRLIFKQASRLFSFNHISMSLVDDSKQHVRQWRFGEYGCVEQPYTIPLNQSRLTQIMEQGQGYIETDLSKKTPDKLFYPDDEILLTDGVRAKITVPLTTKNKPYGAFSLGNQKLGVYGLRELELLEQLAPQIAIAIEKALLIDAMEQRTIELQLLNRLGEMLVSTTKIELIFDTTLNMISRLLPGDVHGIVISAEEGAYVGAAVPFDFSHGDQIIDQVFQTFVELREDQAPVEIITTKCISGNMPVEPRWKPVKVMTLPILTRRGAQGVIYVSSGKEENLSDDVLRIFSLIASQISVAVDNAHLFEQVEQERARLAAILASSTDAVLVVNRNGRIVLDNPAARKVLGTQESQVGNLLAKSTGLQTLIDLFDNAMTGGTTTGEILLNNGRTFFANLSPVTAEGMGVVGWVATMQDVSHFKELDQLKSEFVNTVSHDLRSPLSNVLMATNLIREVGEINQDQRSLLDVIEKRVNAMSHFIEDLLDVGKIEAGLEMEMEPCDLEAIINDVTLALMPQASQKNIRLVQALDQNLPPIMGNTTRMSQVIHNLVGNAIKYTLEDGQVTVKAYPKNGEVQMQVIDTGIGIPPNDRPHVFEKFYRVRGYQALKVKGTGLGLAIVKGIVEKHHGRIWLESSVGKGSTFTVALPIPKDSSRHH